MRQKGARLFFDKITGDIIWEIKEQTYHFDAVNTTIEQDIATFTALSERNRDTFDVLELPFGAYAQDFAECNGYRVNAETKTLEFSYPDPNAPTEPQVFEKPLSTRVVELQDENLNNMLAITSLYEDNIILKTENETLKEENANNMLAITELYEMILGG